MMKYINLICYIHEITRYIKLQIILQSLYIVAIYNFLVALLGLPIINMRQLVSAYLNTTNTLTMTLD